MRKLRTSHCEELRAEIAHAIGQSDDARFLHRLHCVLLASEGPGCYVVARWFREDPRTLERWIHAYESGGADRLRDHHHGGRPPRLTENVARALAADIGRGPVASGYDEESWNGRLLAEHIELRHGVHLGMRQCQRILRRLKVVPS